MTRKRQELDVQEQVSGPTPPAETERRGHVRSLAIQLGTALEQGRSRIDLLDARLEKLAARVPTFSEMGRGVQGVHADGLKRLERLRADALKRMDEAPRDVMSAAAGAARGGLRSLSNELHALAKRLSAAGAQERINDAPRASE